MTIYQDYTAEEFRAKIAKITECEFWLAEDRYTLRCPHMDIAYEMKEYCHTDAIYVESHELAVKGELVVKKPPTMKLVKKTTVGMDFGKLPKGFKF